MTLILDAGALVAIERRDDSTLRSVERERRARRVVVTHGGVVGQVWRAGGPRQALLARALTSIRVEPLDRKRGRRAGELLFLAGTSDVIDAAVVLLAKDGDDILTSDPGDLARLAAAAEVDVAIIAV